MSVRIRADVDDTEVDMAIAKLKQAVSLQGQLAGGALAKKDTRTLMREWRQLESSFADLVAAEQDLNLLERFGAADLPSINRELRVLLGQIPGARQLMQYYFRVIRLQRGVEKALGPKPDLLPITLTLLATAVIIFTQTQRMLDNMARRMKADREEYEEMIREGLELTRDEFVNMDRAQRGWATTWDQFVEMSKIDFEMAMKNLLATWYEEITLEPLPGQVGTLDSDELVG